MFYGLIFDKGMIFDPLTNDYNGYSGLAIFHQRIWQLASWNVVDMLYLPIIEDKTFLPGYRFGAVSGLHSFLPF
jgi:hypothetical protein